MFPWAKAEGTCRLIAQTAVSAVMRALIRMERKAKNMAGSFAFLLLRRCKMANDRSHEEKAKDVPAG
jgi:hypothetical protein